MIEQVDGQVSLFGPDTWCGRTSPERSAPTKDKTSERSLKKSSALPNQKAPMCLCLRGGAGLITDVSTTSWEDGLLLGDFTTRSFGEFPKEENASRLSQILVDYPHPKYYLSAKACVGILKRAYRRKKKLPPALDRALKLQICEELLKRATARGREFLPVLLRYWTENEKTRTPPALSPPETTEAPA